MSIEITIQTAVKAPISVVWDSWTLENHIVNWNFASNEWCCPSAKNDLRENGDFSWRMEAKDGSMGFDFEGTYTKVDEHSFIEYALEDGRKVCILFEQKGDEVLVSETFTAEDQNTAEQQEAGWQAILNNFKLYTEGLD